MYPSDHGDLENFRPFPQKILCGTKAAEFAFFVVPTLPFTRRFPVLLVKSPLHSTLRDRMYEGLEGVTKLFAAKSNKR
jgi:hypothetical protein